jgi:hypothetical protein
MESCIVYMLDKLTKEEFAKMMGDPELINPTIKAIWLCLEKAGYDIVKKGVVVTGTAIRFNEMTTNGDVYMPDSIRFKSTCDTNNQECLTSGRCTGEC